MERSRARRYADFPVLRVTLPIFEILLHSYPHPLIIIAPPITRVLSAGLSLLCSDELTEKEKLMSTANNRRLSKVARNLLPPSLPPVSGAEEIPSDFFCCDIKTKRRSLYDILLKENAA